jgi:hypothetical protein
MVCGQEKFPSPSCGQSASSGRPTEPTVGGRPLQAPRTIPRQRARPASPAATGADFSFASSDFKALGAFFCNFCNSVILAESRTVSRAPRLLHLVGSPLPSPYHFRARIQSFQPVAAPFPGDSILPSGPSRAAIPAIETPLFKHRRSARRSPPGRRCENKHRTSTQLWQEIC